MSLLPGGVVNFFKIVDIIYFAWNGISDNVLGVSEGDATWSSSGVGARSAFMHLAEGLTKTRPLRPSSISSLQRSDGHILMPLATS